MNPLSTRPRPDDPCFRCGRLYRLHTFRQNRRRCRDGKAFKALP